MTPPPTPRGPAPLGLLVWFSTCTALAGLVLVDMPGWSWSHGLVAGALIGVGLRAFWLWNRLERQANENEERSGGCTERSD